VVSSTEFDTCGIVSSADFAGLAVFVPVVFGCDVFTALPAAAVTADAPGDAGGAVTATAASPEF